MFNKADRPSLLHSLDRLYPASYDEYPAAFVSLHQCANEIIWMNKLSEITPVLLFPVSDIFVKF